MWLTQSFMEQRAILKFNAKHPIIITGYAQPHHITEATGTHDGFHSFA